MPIMLLLLIALTASRRAWSLLQRGQVQVTLGKYSEAIKDLDRADALSPKKSEVACALASAYDSRDDLAQALEYADQAAQLSPNNPRYTAYRGRLSCQNGKLDQALDDLNRVIQAYPKNQFARFWRAETYRRKHEIQKAGEEYRQCIQLDPKSSLAQDAQQRLQTLKKGSQATEGSSRIWTSADGRFQVTAPPTWTRDTTDEEGGFHFTAPGVNFACRAFPKDGGQTLEALQQSIVASIREKNQSLGPMNSERLKVHGLPALLSQGECTIHKDRYILLTELVAYKNEYCFFMCYCLRSEWDANNKKAIQEALRSFREAGAP